MPPSKTWLGSSQSIKTLGERTPVFFLQKKKEKSEDNFTEEIMIDKIDNGDGKNDRIKPLYAARNSSPDAYREPRNVQAGRGILFVRHGICSWRSWWWKREQVVAGRAQVFHGFSGNRSIVSTRESHDWFSSIMGRTANRKPRLTFG